MEIKAKGIDVSVHQGNIDFEQVKQSGIDFVVLRAGYGIGHIDPKFYTNYQNAKQAGLDVGAYWYSYADSVDFARQEAESCIEAIKGLQLEYPVYYDVEEPKQIQAGKQFYSSLIKTFCPILEQAGYFAGFYTNLSSLLTVVDKDTANRFTVWCAQWGSNCTYKGSYGMWQYSAKGRISGINTDVDCNYAYFDYPGTIKRLKLNGYGNSQPMLKALAEVAQEVLDGKWNVGEERKRLLIQAGYNYDLVQAEVNKLCEELNKFYTVQKGDTIETICFKFGISAMQLVDLNNWIKPNAKIQVRK